MSYIDPSIDDFKDFFSRDFPYGSGDSQVKDDDLNRAFLETEGFINQALFASQAKYTLGFQYLAAHNLVMDLRQSSQGVSGQVNWMEVGKAVGNVSQNFQIPERILNSPQYGILSQTTYGLRYLSMILNQLVGAMGTVRGRTHPS